MYERGYQGVGVNRNSLHRPQKYDLVRRIKDPGFFKSAGFVESESDVLGVVYP
jgi:hypothetical protein